MKSMSPVFFWAPYWIAAAAPPTIQSVAFFFRLSSIDLTNLKISRRPNVFKGS
jgi:hypothetical protein